MNIIKTPCSIEGCEKPSYRKNTICVAHYERLMRHGDPLAGGVQPGTLMRFVREVAVPYQGGDCLLWPHARNGKGYGSIKIDGKNTEAHRYVCTLVHGMPPTNGHEAAHSCGKVNCVNPNHLSWKTPKENSDDRIIHGTDNRGEKNVRSKITEEQAREILSLRGKEPKRVTAARLGISQTQVSSIQSRRSWACLDRVETHHVALTPAKQAEGKNR